MRLVYVLMTTVGTLLGACPTVLAQQPAGQTVFGDQSLRERVKAQKTRIGKLTRQIEGLQEGRLPAPNRVAEPAGFNSGATSLFDDLPAAGDEPLLALDDMPPPELSLPGEPSAEELQKQVEIQQKQIALLEKMVRLLAGQVDAQGPTVAALQAQVAALEARAKQAAERDQELASGLDNLTDHFDAQQRYGPQLPSQLKELFLPSGTNQTPFSIYNALSMRYQYFPSQKGLGQFQFIEYDAIFLLQLNNRFLFEAQLEVHPDGVEPEFAQIDYVANDWLTVVGGRFMAPLGAFNERLHYLWINKLPDYPIFAWGVIPAFDLNLNGVQLRGSRYVFDSPVKVEYAAYAANGWGLPGQATLQDFADLSEEVDQSKSINNAVAFGGRVGIWLPLNGFFGGVSYFGSRPYTSADGINVDTWDVDLNYHQGNWDLRFECAQMVERTSAFVGNDIRRSGLYGQIAYRPYDAAQDWLQKTEAVFRYSYADIQGLPVDQIDLTAFTFLNQAPVSRNQYTVGLNYYPYPSMAFRLAYEVNNELGVNLKDNVLLAGFAWGF